MRSARASGSGSGLGIDAETLRSLGMSSSEINSLLGSTDDNPSPPPSESSNSELGYTTPSTESSPILESMELDTDIVEDYDDYDEYEYDADFDMLEEEQEVEIEEEELDEQDDDDENIFLLADDEIPETFLDDELEDEEEPFEEEEDIGAVNDDFPDEDEDEVEDGWLDEPSNQLEGGEEVDGEEDGDEYDEEDIENDLDDDDLFVDEIGEDDDEESFFTANDAEMINVDDLDDLEEEDFADEVPSDSEDETLEMEEPLIEGQDKSIMTSQDEYDEDEYEEYDFEDPLEEEEDEEEMSTTLTPEAVESEMEPSASLEDEEEITIDETKSEEGLIEDDEVNLADIDNSLEADQDEGPSITPEPTGPESEDIIEEEIKSDKILNDEELGEREGPEKTDYDSDIVEAELKSEPVTEPTATEMLVSEPEALSQEEPKTKIDDKVDPETSKSISKSETESEPLPDSELINNVRSETNDSKPTFSDINNSAIEGPSKAGKVAIGSALPILLPKIGRSLIGSPVAVQLFALASVGNIAFQHMGALKRKRKDSSGMPSSSSTVVETTATDEAFDAAADLDYEESDYVEDVEGYGFGRPRPQRRPQRQIQDDEGGLDDLIEVVEEPKKKNKRGLGGFGLGKRHRKPKKGDSDITIVDTSATSTVAEVPVVPKKRGMGFGLMGRNSLEHEFDKALKEIEELKIRAKKAEDTRDQLEIDCDSAMHQVSSKVFCFLVE